MLVLQLGEGNKTYFTLVKASVWLVYLWDWFMEPIHTYCHLPDTSHSLAHDTMERHKFGINSPDLLKNHHFGQEAFFYLSWWECVWLLHGNLSVRSFSFECLSWNCSKWATSTALQAESAAFPGSGTNAQKLWGRLAITVLLTPSSPS